MNAGFPVVRPRRLRRTPALRALVAETSLRPARAGAAGVRQGRASPSRSRSARCPASSSTPGTACARRPRRRPRPGVGGLIVFGIPAVKDGRGSAADDPAGISQLALADLRAEVGDACVIMADLCLCEYTDHGHCGAAHRGRLRRQRRDARAVRRDRGRPGAGGRAPGRAERDDGRPGGGDPGGARRRGLTTTSGSAPTRPSTPPPSTARSARPPRARRSSATGPATSRTRPTRSRRCGRWRSTSTRAPTW